MDSRTISLVLRLGLLLLLAIGMPLGMASAVLVLVMRFEPQLNIAPPQLRRRNPYWEAGDGPPQYPCAKDIRALDGALLPNIGPPEAGFSRLFHDDGLVTPSG